MEPLDPSHLVRIRPRPDTIYVTQGRTVLVTARDGFIDRSPEHGLFVHQTRMLSLYRIRIAGRVPEPVVLSISSSTTGSATM